MPDVAADAAAAKADVEVAFHDASAIKEDVAPVRHDAAPVTPDAEVDVPPTPPLRTDAAIPVDTAALDTAAGADTVPAVDTLPVIDTAGPADVATSPDARPACVMPSYPKDCSEVSLFECGFSAKCENGVIAISWHQHACNGDSWVSYYDCTYTCPKGCKSAGVAWTSPGTKLVEETCNP